MQTELRGIDSYKLTCPDDVVRDRMTDQWIINLRNEAHDCAMLALGQLAFHYNLKAPVFKEIVDMFAEAVIEQAVGE